MALYGAPRLEPRGRVLDASSGEPIGAATVSAGGVSVSADRQGTFQLPQLRLWEPVRAEALGYQAVSAPPWPPRELELRLEPLSADVRTLDAESGQPLASTVVSTGGRVEQVGPGWFRVTPALPDTRVSVDSPDHAGATVSLAGGSALDVRLAPDYLGQVVDDHTGRPVRNAALVVNGTVVETDAESRFRLSGPPQGPVAVIAPGYRRKDVTPLAASLRVVRLEPRDIRGLYLTYFAAGDEQLRSNVLELLRTTEANALVIDVKGDRGFLSYRGSVGLADRIGANDQPTIPDIERFLSELHQAGIYTIARIVTFKDDRLARDGPRAGVDVGIKDAATGGLWVDGEGLGWVDPFREEAWAYNLALATEAVRKGFDEIQFDYIRFPTDPSDATSVGAARYSREYNQANRVQALEQVLRQAREALHPLGATLAVDTFGYSCWSDDDLGIGQYLPAIANQVDVISPMIYPSTFAAGLPGSTPYPDVVSQPFEVVLQSLQQAHARVDGRRAVLRPWLQYFDDYSWETGKQFNAPEIQAQIRAAVQAGSPGWLLWDPSNRYARGGLLPRGGARTP
ncbi:MAG: GTP-binding protein [Chloroflexi bacterium]|nr:GTP-binding protein [Chloroflexota bacterium]